MSKSLTATDFYRYLQCPHWPYWERFGDPKDRRPLTEAEEQRLADGLEHEDRVVREEFGPFQEIKTPSAEKGFAQTLALMRAGAPVIYQGWLADGDWVGRPDILERQEGKSSFGDWHYVPLDVKRSHELKKEHKAQLTFYAVLLERIQGRFPARPAVINKDHERLEFDPSEFMEEFQGLVAQLERIRAAEKPDPVYRKSCEDTSPWGKACFRLAKEQDDIALIFNVDVKKLRLLRSFGIRTVEDAAAIDPFALEGQGPGLTLRALEAIKRQAQSLRDKLVMVREPFLDPTEGLEIHFDIESHPPTDADYLYGLWVRDGAKETYRAFVAERPEDEGRMWRAFLAWLSTLPERYTVYHYASYEPSRLTILAERYGDTGHPDLERFLSRLQDLKEIVRDHAVFPLYFYSLKKVAQFLGFAWTGEVKGGGESVTAYDKWLATNRRHILESILQYNEEDVRATAFLLDWLREHAGREGSYAPPYPWGGKS